MNILKFIATAICLVCALSNSYAGQADWQKDWEQTLAAAKKEGQVSIYIYRYEGLLQDFKKDFPGINVVAVSGRGNELTNRIIAERRAGKYIVDVYSGGTNSLYNTLYKGKALDPFKPLLVLPEVTDVSKWWGKEHRYADPEGKYHLFVHRQPEQFPTGVQPQAGQSQGVQLLLGGHQPEMEGQDRLSRPARYRAGRDHAVLLLQSGNRPGVYEEILRRYGYHLRKKFSPDDRLVGTRKICHLHGM
jgi:hypothetical protein